MGRITSGIGLVSGINSKDIIDQLMSIEQRPKTLLQTRIDSIGQQKLAYTDLTTRLSSIRINAQSLKKISTFQNAKATSGNEDVLTATASAGAAVGSYQFQVARLVTTQQNVSRGFIDFDTAKVGAGTITIEQGGGDLAAENQLADLNGGAGVRRGQFRITDRAGNNAIIDTTAAVSLQDVIKKINTTLDISVRASVDGDKLVLTDLTGKTASNLKVEDLAEGHSAEDLGIVANTATNKVTGGDIVFLGRNQSLSQINDGRGVRKATSGDDVQITLRNGTTTGGVSLASAKTLGDVVDLVNNDADFAGLLKAELVGNGVRLTDLSAGSVNFAVTNQNGSRAATDLGIETSTTTSTITGKSLLAGLGTTLLSSLNGGSGLTLGTVTFQNRAGTSKDVDLTGANSVQDVIDKINDAGAGVKASLNASGNGLQLVDTSGGTGNLVITDVDQRVAQALGISGTFDNNTPTVRGANLQKQWISENSLLSQLNGGKGVSPGRFQITAADGRRTTVTVNQSKTRLNEVIADINSKGIGVTARVNDNGDGLLLVDATSGAGKLKVENLEGTSATDLNIAGTATANTINGSYEKTVTVSATDTLSTLQTKINDLGFGVSAQIINDGSADAPYRLSLTARNTGRAGRVVLDAGSTTLDTRTLVESQDAAVFIGGATAEQPLLVTASRNQLAGVVQGVSIELNGVSDKPVSLSITRDVDNVVEEITKFTTTFNDLTTRLKELTKFDTDTKERGLLLGEGTVQDVETKIYSVFTSFVAQAGRFRTLADLGIKLGDGSQVEFDEDKFRAAYAEDPESVTKLFTASSTTTGTDGKDVTTFTGMGFLLESTMNKLIDPVDGAITRQNKELDSRTLQFQDRIKSLDAILTTKRTRLERQFSNLESVLSGLQSQQTAIGQIQSVT